MKELTQTKVQKIILLIGGLLVSGILVFESNFSVALGFSILTVVLLTITKGYIPSSRTLAITKYVVYLVLTFVLLVWLLNLYNDRMFRLAEEEKQAEITKEKQLAEERFHTWESNYQKCLDKVASLDKFEETSTTLVGKPFTFTKKMNLYQDEWVAVGRPYYNQANTAYRWEWAFMKWMVQNHEDYCKEFDTETIKLFLKTKG